MGRPVAEELVGFLLYGVNMHSGNNEFVTDWQLKAYPHDPAAHRGAIGPLRTWDGLTRLEGPWTFVLLALCLAGPWVLSGRARAGMLLFATTALALLLFPILVKGYDYRFVIPGYAPLVAAGALSAWGLAVKASSKLPDKLRRGVPQAG